MLLAVCVATLGARASILAAPIKPSVVDASNADDATNRPPEVLNAIEAFNQGKISDAFALLGAAAAKYPHLPPARVMLANLYFTSDQPAAGRLELERMVAEDPSDPESYLIFGDILRQQSYLTAAAALYAQAGPLVAAFDKDPARKKNLQVRLHSNSASVGEARQQWPAVLADLEAWLKVDPDSVPARGRLGRALFFLDRSDEAYQQFQAADGDGGRLATSAEIAMMHLYHARGQHQQATEWKDKALSQSPERFDTQLGVTRWLWETGQVEQAGTHARAALQINPESIDAIIYCGLVARLLANDAEAEKYFQSALEKSPGNVAASNQLALVLAGQQDAARQSRALGLASMTVKANPQNTEAMATLGWVLHRVGRTQDAAEKLRALRSGRHSLSRDSAYLVAQVLFALGHQEDARRLLQSALDGRGPFIAEAAARQWNNQLSARSE